MKDSGGDFSAVNSNSASTGKMSSGDEPGTRENCAGNLPNPYGFKPDRGGYPSQKRAGASKAPRSHEDQ